MDPLKYSDDQISENEFMIALPSIIIGVSILSLPSEIAKVTSFSDGWIPILLGGIIFTFITIIAVKLAALFPEQSFMSYTTFLVTKPVAIGIAWIHIIIVIFAGAYAVRSVAFISQQYLFDQTPMEVLALAFLLVIIYAISGSRAGLFRLNVLFLPIILIAFLFVVLFNMKWFETVNLLPMFKSDATDYMKGITKSFQAYGGFGIVLFYFVFIRKPTNMTKKIVIGMSVSTLFYLIIFLATIAVFGNAVTENLGFPTIELAKRVDIPGAIFERIDALVFTIWAMAIFNTATMTLDTGVLLLTSLFKKVEKKVITIILSPIIFYISMFPQQLDQVQKSVNIFSVLYISFTVTIIFGLLLIANIRGVKNRAKK